MLLLSFLKKDQNAGGDYYLEYIHGLLLNNMDAAWGAWSELYWIATMLFLAGIGGLLESDNFLAVLINSEITMLGNNFHLLVSALILADIKGQLYVLNFLSATASETTVGLGLLVLFYRTKGRMFFESILGLRG